MRSREHELMLLCARMTIDNASGQKIKELLALGPNWDKIISLSNKHEITPFLYYNLNKPDFQDKVPQTALSHIKSYYYANTFRNLAFEKEMFLILGLAGFRNIDIVPLKGFSLAQILYNNPGLRVMADIDILIKKQDLNNIKPVFAQLGYKENTTDPDDCRHMAIFSKKLASKLFINIEIHSGLAYARPNKINIPDLMQRACKNINNQTLLFLSPEDTFISLALHLRSHTRRLTLKFIIDIAELLNKDGDKFDWSYIKRAAKDNHFMASVYLFLYLSRELLEARIPPGILDEFKPGKIKKAFIHACINKHNFLVMKKWRGVFARLLIFDNLYDFIVYLWRVSFIERAIKNNSSMAKNIKQ